MSSTTLDATPEAAGAERARLAAFPVAGPDDDAGLSILAALPRDHAPWARDAVTLSARARALIAALRPIAFAVLTFWDHAKRACTAGSRALRIDASGSYRIE